MFQQIKNRIFAGRHYRIDQNGIMQRYLNEQGNWNEHLEKSKKTILQRVNNPKCNSIAILGSGWLLDVPIIELLERVHKIYLYDIAHPRQIINKYKNESKIEFITTDLTNGLVLKATQANSLTEFVNELKTTPPQNIFDKYDVVVSLNLLNQLDILLCDYLKKRFDVNLDTLQEIRTQIQHKHITCLPEQKSLIITDHTELNYLDSKTIQKETDLIYVDLSTLKNIKQWIWSFDSKKSYRTNFNTSFKVVAGEL